MIATRRRIFRLRPFTLSTPQVLVDPWLVGNLTFGSEQLGFLYTGYRPDGARRLGNDLLCGRALAKAALSHLVCRRSRALRPRAAVPADNSAIGEEASVILLTQVRETG